MGSTLSAGVRRRTRRAHMRPGCIGATETELFTRARSGETAAREQLVCRFLPMARSLASRYRRGGESLDDLVQVASVALVKALARFDHERGVAFPSYAVPTIVGELKRHLRDTSWRLHVPRPLKEQALRLCRAADELHQRLGRSPTTTELAEHLGIGEEEVLEGLAAAGSRLEVSLDQPVGDDGDTSLGDLMAAAGAREEPEDLLVLPGLVAALPALEREVIILRFFKDLDQYEIAAQVGFSQMHISRLQRRALASMRAQLVQP
jgi:RNA polymerase sigma-B factor